ncbi:MAG: ATP-binding protein, partial [Sphaerospermopsis kisseleviana]
FNDSLDKRKSVEICSFKFSENRYNEQILVCQFDGIDVNDINKFLIELSNKIFLTAHISQIFLFIRLDYRKELFANEPYNNFKYYANITSANSKLPGFFTYDF